MQLPRERAQGGRRLGAILPDVLASAVEPQPPETVVLPTA